MLIDSYIMSGFGEQKGIVTRAGGSHSCTTGSLPQKRTPASPSTHPAHATMLYAPKGYTPPFSSSFPL